MNSIHEEINYFRSENKKNPLREVAKKISKKYKLICFDELEIIDIADAMLVSKVFDTLIEKKVSFVITSNYKPTDLYKDGLQRSQFEPFIEIIKQKMQIIEIKNNSDLRLSKENKSIDNFFYPLNKKTQIEFEKLFFKSEAVQNIRTTKILSLGRMLIFKKCLSNSLSTDFNYICSYKFSANDYIKISNCFDWIFIDNIPLLGRNKFNEIRRFIILIDILYEKKNKVIMRAEKNIANLFQVEKSKQPYSRTVSRIVEMSSSDWLENEIGGDFV